MKILVLNSGSSSLKYKLFDMENEKELLSGHVDGIGLERCRVKVKSANGQENKKEKIKDHVDAVMRALKSLKQRKVINDFSEIKAAGHRVVHGGEKYSEPAVIDDDVVRAIKELYELAPLHNPHNLAGIMACKKMLPRAKQVAVFDTAFHQSMKPEAYLYGLPYSVYEKHRIRKYGFHGTSHKYVAEKARELLDKKECRLITCHLGNGASITAVRNNKSIDTSMGLTPLEGLVMGTRCGSIDPAVPLVMVRQKGMKPAEADEMLNKKSGLRGISGLSSDVRDLHQAELKRNSRAGLALDIFARRAAFYIAGYMAMLGGVDALVFTAGIGEGAYFVRKRICKYLECFDIKLDDELNKKNELFINKHSSKAKLMVIKTNEELQIAREAKGLLKHKN